MRQKQTEVMEVAHKWAPACLAQQQQGSRLELKGPEVGDVGQMSGEELDGQR